MATYAAGGLTTAGSTTLPIFGLISATTVAPIIIEIGIWNTTATAVALKLCRISTAGTPGSTLTSAALDNPVAPASLALLKNTFTSTAPTTSDLGFRTVLGAAVGSGVIWTFGNYGLNIAPVANAGVGCLVENGTGQACQIYVKWVE